MKFRASPGLILSVVQRSKAASGNAEESCPLMWAPIPTNRLGKPIGFRLIVSLVSFFGSNGCTLFVRSKNKERFNIRIQIMKRQEPALYLCMGTHLTNGSKTDKIACNTLKFN